MEIAGDSPDVRPRADYDDRDTIVPEDLPPIHDKLDAAHERQSQIEDDHIRLAGESEPQRVLAIERRDGLVPGVAQRHLKESAGRVVVLYHEDPKRRHARTLRFFMRRVSWRLDTRATATAKHACWTFEIVTSDL